MDAHVDVDTQIHADGEVVINEDVGVSVDAGVDHVVGVGVDVNGCADRVTATWLSTSDDFVVGSDIYTVNVTGFSLDPSGSDPFTSFWTAENGHNHAYLLANVALRREVEPIPEPGTLGLLGLGLLGFARGQFSRRRAPRKDQA